jgi:DNA-binding SARP family transcriptional activator/tetratricopeptide (TPR) repeat protein
MKFGVLGPLRARIQEQDVRTEGLRQAKVLAALLIEANRVVSVQRLVSVVWEGDEPVTAVRQVQDSVSGLRRVLGAHHAPPELITTHRRGYRIQLQPQQLDLLEFERQAQLAKQHIAADDRADAVAALRRALDCWRGPALPDIPGQAIEADSTRLNHRRLTTHKQCLALELALGRHHEIADEATALMGEHPFDEQIAEQAMVALYRSGRRGDALSAYDELRRTLADELGIDPAPAVRELHRRILDADPDLAGAPASAPSAPVAPVAREIAQLPSDIPDFTGRGSHVADLRQLLSERRGNAVVVSTLTGAGGVGKTTLAVHVGHLLRGEFPDGQLYVNLRAGSGQQVAAEEVLARFLRDLGVPGQSVPVGEDERAALYRSLLAGRRMLVLLDDARDDSQVRPLLPGTASCSVLVTSRDRLPGLDGARRLDVDVLDPADARALFTAIVGADRAAAEPEAVAEVLESCAGLPLAIRIAGARLATRPGWRIRTLADRLADARRRLDELRIGNLAVRASYEVAYQSLSGPADPARAFRLMGLLDGPTVGLEAAAALLGRPAGLAEEALEQLVDVQLLQSPAPGRYRFHDLLRVYAAERADAEEPPAERDEARRRALSWYLHTAAAAARVLNPGRKHVELAAPEPEFAPAGFAGYAQAMAWSERERSNLVAATGLAVRTGLFDIAWRLPVALWDLLQIRGHLSDWIRTHELGLIGARALGDRSAEATLLNNVAPAYRDSGRPAEDISCLRQALAIRRGEGNRRGQAANLINLGLAYDGQGQFENAVRALQEALAISREIGLRAGEGGVHHNLGEIYKRHDYPAQALTHCQLALAVHRETSGRRNEGQVLTNIGEIYEHLGRWELGAGFAEQGLAVAREVGSPHDEAMALDVLGRCALAGGRPERAAGHWQESLRIFDGLRAPEAGPVRTRLRALAG